ncbi:MAG: accessory Sec system glycosylation chaperone GtfB [Lachnospiraceae bacterium]|uniref:UDP-N-acetylglucosamine--peptide N-acetylglucosaminyltransferase stabilizing protein GtfB n=1 Tax=Candidatus Weimeria bifida TaxID=2599074 RepID=A0A6N7IY69_9FIRM|nr:accessory Sec system glycosylation chaperone GtfB [Candidatus Weimeria bifida]RRF96050.1 MAG: accessory Sec system glycosylation chaperone GtfB [Lachnospiraceae bacterium]
MERRDPIKNKSDGSVDGVLLLDSFDEQAQMLAQSFQAAGFCGPVVVIHDDGFLPDEVMSVREWFSKDRENEFTFEHKEKVSEPSEKTGAYHTMSEEEYALYHQGFKPGRPRFFDQIEVPDYWEITSTLVNGEIHDLHNLRGRMYYHLSSENRFVSDVDWFGPNGNVRFTDHYDNHGRLFSRTTFNIRGERFCRTWFDEKNREKIVENLVTGDIIVTRDKKTELYRNLTDLTVQMLREIGVEGERIFYNSLSTPLFVSEKLGSNSRKNVLFWQEGPRDDIPGNMQEIFNGPTKTGSILVQNRESYSRLISLGASGKILRPFGFVYNFVRENNHTKNALIFTNSDQIESLEPLVRALPEITFNIAAVTEMSGKLMAFGHFENVRLYPTVRKNVTDELFEKCDLYFDINYGNEILASVRRAFLNNQLIMGFDKTLHRRRYLAPREIFTDVDQMIAKVKRVVSDRSAFDRGLAEQKENALAESVESLRDIFYEE